MMLEKFLHNFIAYAQFNPDNPPTIPEIIAQVFPTIQLLIFGLGPVLLVVAVVYAGYTRLIALDNKQKIMESNSTIMWAAIGYGVVLLSMLIIRLVASALGYDIGTSVDVNF